MDSNIIGPFAAAQFRESILVTVKREAGWRRFYVADEFIIIQERNFPPASRISALA
jgi:hypothetical protein